MIVTNKQRTFTDQERAVFASYVKILSEQGLFEKVEMPFGNDTTLNIAFFLWQQARDDVLELAETLADTEDDVSMLVYKLRKGVVLSQPYPPLDYVDVCGKEV